MKTRIKKGVLDCVALKLRLVCGYWLEMAVLGLGIPFGPITVSYRELT
jgi:hypothetical protein